VEGKGKRRGGKETKIAKKEERKNSEERREEN